MQVCISLQTDNHASTSPLVFLQAGCPSCCPTNSVKAMKVQNLFIHLAFFKITKQIYKNAIFRLSLMPVTRHDDKIKDELSDPKPSTVLITKPQWLYDYIA